MLKKILLFTLILSAVFFSAEAVKAQAGFSEDISAQLGAAAGKQGAGFAAPQDPRLIVANTIKIILGFIGTIFLVLTLYAGFKWMTAAGNEDEVTQAKTLLNQAVIGLIVILMAYSITILAVRIALGEGMVSGGGWWIQQPPLQNQSGVY
jgi:hypothetical protein